MWLMRIFLEKLLTILRSVLNLTQHSQVLPMLVEEALLNEQETLFRFIFAIYLWKNEKTITFVSQIAGWQLFVWYKS